jgi:hypothetical protein
VVTLEGAGQADFGKIKYTLKDAGKTYNYEITETTTGFSNAWSKDPGKVTVTVEVGKDNGGQLAPSVVTYDPTATITNKYASTGHINFEAKKVLEGKKLAAGQFEFKLLEGNKELQVKYNDANGKVTFTPEWTAEMTVSALGENQEIIMPICKVWVDDVPENSDTNTPGDNIPTNPSTGTGSSNGNGTNSGSDAQSSSTNGGCGGCKSTLGGISIIAVSIVGASACVLKRKNKRD